MKRHKEHLLCTPCVHFKPGSWGRLVNSNSLHFFFAYILKMIKKKRSQVNPLTHSNWLWAICCIFSASSAAYPRHHPIPTLLALCNYEASTSSYWCPGGFGFTPSSKSAVSAGTMSGSCLETTLETLTYHILYLCQFWAVSQHSPCSVLGIISFPNKLDQIIWIWSVN